MYGFVGSLGWPNFVGTIALLVSFVRVILNHFTNHHHFGFESAIWYWHFVDGADIKYVICRFKLNIFKLKGQMRYFGYVLESILRVVFSSIYQVILSAQKAVLGCQSRGHVSPKMNKIRPQNWTIVPLLNLGFNLNKVIYRFSRSDGFKEYRICSSMENMYGIVCMCTSHWRMFKPRVGRLEKTFLPC